MEKIKAKVEGLLHKNEHDTTTAGTHNTTTGAGTHSAAHNTTTGTGTHSGVLGDERHGNPSHVGSTGHAGGLTDSTTHSGAHTHGSDPTGPHDSRLGNKADPRVDSDHVGGYGNTGSGNTHGIHSGPLAGAGQTHSDPNGPRGVGSDHVGGLGNTHSGHGGGLTGNTHHHSDPNGPHDIPLANQLDPRVNNDTAYGSAAPYSGGLTGNTSHGAHTHGSHTHGSDPTGPHDSRLGNKADPRVDSDHVGGYGNAGHSGGLTGTHTGGGLTGSNTYGSDPTGPHDSRLGNRADPRIDSDRVGEHGNIGHSGGGLTGGYGNAPQTEGFGNATGGGLSGTPAHGHHEHGLAGQGSHLPGPAQNTAGPHKSDMLNKADPRVDADLDGSKTYGGNKTYAA